MNDQQQPPLKKQKVEHQIQQPLPAERSSVQTAFSNHVPTQHFEEARTIYAYDSLLELLYSAK